jgi:hypothetical protein
MPAVAALLLAMALCHIQPDLCFCCLRRVTAMT